MAARVAAQPGRHRPAGERPARPARRASSGPDPASEIACTIGGVVANNSSGMACGIDQNTYRTLESLVLVLPSGTILDTGAADADELLRAASPRCTRTVCELRDRLARRRRRCVPRSRGSSR